MTLTSIEALVACQDRMIAALDGRCPDAIATATADLALAIVAAKQTGLPEHGQRDRERIDHALRQNDAARMRVNILSDWNRDRTDRLAELRGASATLAYRRPRLPK